jgi:hypothetical protein
MMLPRTSAPAECSLILSFPGPHPKSKTLGYEVIEKQTPELRGSIFLVDTTHQQFSLPSNHKRA